MLVVDDGHQHHVVVHAVPDRPWKVLSWDPAFRCGVMLTLDEGLPGIRPLRCLLDRDAGSSDESVAETGLEVSYQSQASAISSSASG